jgi:tyrosine-specific transport protein
MDEAMDQQKAENAGSLPGAILLIAGCCIGAGMLGVPVVSALAGFKPSLCMFLVSWLFMTATALLLLEVTLSFREEVNLVTMAEKCLGWPGKWAAWACFLFLFYALGVAYLAGSGELVSDFISENFQMKVPHIVGTVAVSILFGGFVYAGTHAVDLFNRLLMAGLAASYLLLVEQGLPHIHMENLRHSNWSVALFILPILLISFGFHNLIPSLTYYLQRDARRLRLAVLCGSAIPLLIYLVWEWLILGLVPIYGQGGFLEILEKGQLATDILREKTGSLKIVQTAQYFALFAILTSFLGNSLSFVDFLADGWHVKKEGIRKLLLCAAVVVPPFVMAYAYPNIFLTALHYAGAFGAVILFGILPALMVWSVRYRRPETRNSIQQMLPGGKAALLCIILFALVVIGLQFVEAG